MRLITALSTLLPLVSSSLLVDYTGGEPTSVLGSCQLEGQNPSDAIACPGNSNISIKPGVDPAGKPALVFHRDAHFRRAEVKAGTSSMFEQDAKYYIGYNVMIENNSTDMVLFQWKRADKTVTPQDNIPFNLGFTAKGLALSTTTPGGGGSNRFVLATVPFSTHKPHNIAIAFDTQMNGGSIVSQNNRIAFWLDGKKIFDGDKYSTWSTKTLTYPKFGEYRGEYEGTNDLSETDPKYVYDSYLYRAQISNKGFDEIAKSAGVPAGAT